MGDHLARYFDAGSVVLVARVRMVRATAAYGAWPGSPGQHIVTDCEFVPLTTYKATKPGVSHFRLLGGRISSTEWSSVSWQPACAPGAEVLVLIAEIRGEYFLASQNQAYYPFTGPSAQRTASEDAEAFVSFLASGGDL